MGDFPDVEQRAGVCLYAWAVGQAKLRERIVDPVDDDGIVVYWAPEALR
jgi:hypothetical protein